MIRISFVTSKMPSLYFEDPDCMTNLPSYDGYFELTWDGSLLQHTRTGVQRILQLLPNAENIRLMQLRQLSPEVFRERQHNLAAIRNNMWERQQEIIRHFYD